MKKLLSTLLALSIIALPVFAGAQVFRTAQMIPSWGNGTGVVYATSTSAGSFLTATTGPTVAFITATSTILKSFFPLSSTTVSTIDYGFVNNWLDFTGISTPTAPASGHAQIYSVTTNGITRPTVQDGCAEYTLGRDSVYVARNTSASTVNKGDIVSVTGSTGNIPNIAASIMTQTASMVDGVVIGGIGSSSIGVNNYGCILKLGILTGLNTSGYASGDMLYVSTTTPGAIVNYAPVYPDVAQMIGEVLVSGVGNGSIFYHITSGQHNKDTGSINNSWGIGSFLSSGARALSFSNSVGTTTITNTPSGVKAITLPAQSGTLALSASYPVQLNSTTGDISLAFGTTTNNTWSGNNLFTGSTTAINLTSINATTTNATTTVFTVSSNHITIGTNSAHLTGTTSPAFNIASTTLDAMGKSFNIGTTTLLMKNWPMAYSLDGFYCVASTTGTAIVNFSHDNGNKTEYSICTTGSYTRTATNNTFTAFENFNVQASSTAGAVNRITITTVGHYTSD